MRQAIVSLVAALLGVDVRFRPDGPIHEFDVVKEFHHDAGPPQASMGAGSGEELCSVLLDKLSKYERIRVDMSGWRRGKSAAFLKWAFGGLRAEYSPSDIFDRIIVRTYEPSDLNLIASYVDPARDSNVPLVQIEGFVVESRW